jgi:hypothetical protein
MFRIFLECVIVWIKAAHDCWEPRPHSPLQDGADSCVLSGKQIICACAKGILWLLVLCLPRDVNSADGLQPIREWHVRGEGECSLRGTGFRFLSLLLFSLSCFLLSCFLHSVPEDVRIKLCRRRFWSVVFFLAGRENASNNTWLTQ